MGFFSTIIRDSRLRVGPGSRGLAMPPEPPPVVASCMDDAVTSQRNGRRSDQGPRPNRPTAAPDAHGSPLTSAAVADPELTPPPHRRGESRSIDDDSPRHPLERSAGPRPAAAQEPKVVRQRLSVPVEPTESRPSPSGEREPPGGRAAMEFESTPGSLSKARLGMGSGANAPSRAESAGGTSTDVRGDIPEHEAVASDGDNGSGRPTKPVAEQSDMAMDVAAGIRGPELRQAAQAPSPGQSPTQMLPPSPPLTPLESAGPSPSPPQGRPQTPQVRIGQVTVVVEGPNRVRRICPSAPDGPGERQLLRGL